MTVAIGNATVIVADRLQSSPLGEADIVRKVWTRGPWALALAGDSGIGWRLERTALTGLEPDFLDQLADEAMAWEAKASGATVEILACHPDLGAWSSTGVGFTQGHLVGVGGSFAARAAWYALGMPTDANGLRRVVEAVCAASPGMCGGGVDVMVWDEAGGMWR
jgi:hypothetical protein